MTSPAALQRQAALVGAALLAGLLVVVLDRSPRSTPVASPPAVAGEHWQSAAVGVGRVTQSNLCATSSSGAQGVIHPVLPCGVKLEVSAHGRDMRAVVVARGPVAAGTSFALTRGLAAGLGVRDGDRIRWRFAG